MTLKPLSLATKVLAAALCLSIPWTTFAVNLGEGGGMEQPASEGSPIVPEQLELTLSKFFPENADSLLPGAETLIKAQMSGLDAKTYPELPHMTWLGEAVTLDSAGLEQKIAKAKLPDATAAKVRSLHQALQKEADSNPKLAVVMANLSNARIRKERQGTIKESLAKAHGLAQSLANNVKTGLVDAVTLSQPASGPDSSKQEAAFLESYPEGGSHRKVAELRRTAEKEPQKGFSEAAAILADRKDPRFEVRLAALSVVGEASAEQSLPVLMRVLQGEKDEYLRRKAAQLIGRKAAEIKGRSREEPVVQALETSLKDRAINVALMAEWSLGRLGRSASLQEREQKSREEIQRELNREAAGAVASLPSGPAIPMPSFKEKMAALRTTLLVMAAAAFMVAWLVMSYFATMPAPPKNHPAPPAHSQIEAASESPAKTPEEKLLRDISKNVERMAAAQEKRAKMEEQAFKNAEKAAQKEQEARAKQGGIGAEARVWIMIIAIMLGITWFQVKIQRGQMGGMGKGGLGGLFGGGSKKVVERPTTRLADSAGLDDTAMKKIRQYLNYRKKIVSHKFIGSKPPRGMFFFGPPGGGKTHLARAIAGEMGVPILEAAGAEFVEMFVGVGASRVRDLFDQAAELAKKGPVVVFIDEIDAIGRSRSLSSFMGGGQQESQNTLTQLLVELDGFQERNPNVILIAASNLKKSALRGDPESEPLDPALTRPGRFDQLVFIGQPDHLGREAILAVHSKKVRMAADVDLEFAASRTKGLMGADLMNIINTAALDAGDRDDRAFTNTDLQNAVNNATVGAPRDLYIDEKTEDRTAKHELGHTLGRMLATLQAEREAMKAAGRSMDDILKAKIDVETPDKVTLIPGEGSLGHTQWGGGSDGDLFLRTKKDLKIMLVGAMGGRAAEELSYPGDEGESTGPGSDLKQATRISRVMAGGLGMDKKVGLISLDPDAGDPSGASWIPEQTKQDVVDAVKALNGNALAEAKRLLSENRDMFEALVKALKQKETLYKADIEEIFWKHQNQKDAQKP